MKKARKKLTSTEAGAGAAATGGGWVLTGNLAIGSPVMTYDTELGSSISYSVPKGLEDWPREEITFREELGRKFNNWKDGYFHIINNKLHEKYPRVYKLYKEEYFKTTGLTGSGE